MCDLAGGRRPAGCARRILARPGPGGARPRVPDLGLSPHARRRPTRRAASGLAARGGSGAERGSTPRELGFESLLMVCLPTAEGCWGLVEVYAEDTRFDQS